MFSRMFCFHINKSISFCFRATVPREGKEIFTLESFNFSKTLENKCSSLLNQIIEEISTDLIFVTGRKDKRCT